MLSSKKIEEIIDERKRITANRSRKVLLRILRAELKAALTAKKLNAFSRVKIHPAIRKYRKQLDLDLKEVFQEFELEVGHRKTLARILGALLTRQLFDPEHVTGVVVAGFGDSEHYPAMVQYVMDGLVAEKLRFLTIKKKGVTQDDSVFIMPFAQSEMVQTFMEGIDPDLKEVLDSYLKTVLLYLPESIFSELKTAGLKIKSGTQKAVKTKAEEIYKNISKHFADHCETNHIDPVVAATALLPKDELAAMAEALVNLTSFRRRVSLAVETVGGPIDVAVISKGDGFVWIKRKHYFKSELNPDFFDKNRALISR